MAFAISANNANDCDSGGISKAFTIDITGVSETSGGIALSGKAILKSFRAGFCVGGSSTEFPSDEVNVARLVNGTLDFRTYRFASVAAAGGRPAKTTKHITNTHNHGDQNG